MAAGKVVVLVKGYMDSEQWDIFKSKIPAGWQVTLVDMNEGEAKVAAELKDAEYLISQASGPIPARLIENAGKLKLIQTGGQDTGHLPVEYAIKKGIFVANAGGANANAVAEYTVTLMMMCLRRIQQFNQTFREEKWRTGMPRAGSYEMYDKTVGIVGMGNIGSRVARLCSAFGANIIYYERFFVPYALRMDFKGQPVELDELLKKSDIVTLHVPSFSANKAMIGWEQLNMMKPTAFLINTSRGANIDEKALVRALNEKKIAGAALDVWDPEPPDPKNPLIFMPNVIATPHIAWLSVENLGPTFETVWRNVLAVSEGKEPPTG